MIDWIRSPIKLLVAVVVLAVTLKWLVIPGALIAVNAGTIDRHVEAIEARLVSVEGQIVSIAAGFATSDGRTYYRYTPTYEARVPDRADPLRVVGLQTSIKVRSGSTAVPPRVPKVGDPVTLWYDPTGTYATWIAPTGETGSVLWVGLVLLGVGVIGLVIAAVLIRLAIRRPTRAPG